MVKNLLTLLLYFVIFIITNNLKAQDPEKYNLIYSKTYLETSQKDFKKALEIADSLYKISETPKFKAKSLMLSATLIQQSGNDRKSLEYALKAEEYVRNSDDYLWQSKIYGFLSSQYRSLGLFNQAKDYINKSEYVIKKINNASVASNMLGLVMQEKAYCEIEFNHYKKALYYVNQSNHLFKSIGNREPTLVANNYQLEGICYYKLGDNKRALSIYQKAASTLAPMSDNYLKGLIFSGIAQVYIETKNLDKAKLYLDKAESIAEQSNYLSLKDEIYNTSQQYYFATKNIEKLAEVKIKQDSTKEKISYNTSAFIDKEYSDSQQKYQIEEKKSHRNSLILILLITLFCVYIILIFIKSSNYKANHTNIKVNTKQIQDNHIHQVFSLEENIQQESTDKEIITNLDFGQPAMMTPATEKKLLAKLEKFENSTLFTRNSISLPYLATYCDTNTKYLSYVINNFKHKDFNNYINELRIKYILEKLKSDSKYQKYKIASLADEAGFSSQSKFAVAFKKITDISPSHYLQALNEEKLNN
ncbi:helix-turn-helix domain-containing protein [Chryseobacterium aahli]|uniref:helix-turn-helix domain-containing protein n=1 Tax=Chryseobacterium aahli TaxID=1278643 RepID=UPI001F61541F|nr:helix-turn-helix domain-containing protein [Chryseobacterium aahli]MCI3936009.1 helix-turn-helix domain-containing protein [Chryseobacterium aahli]